MAGCIGFRQIYARSFECLEWAVCDPALQAPRGTRSWGWRSGTVTPVTATSPPPGAGFDHDLPEPAEVALRLGRAVETTYAATDVPLAPAFTGGAFQ